MAARRKSGTQAAPGGLTRERIETVALQLIEAHGLEALSMRKLGTALRCEAMSLYHHHPSKAHLLDGILDRLLASLPPSPPALPFGERVRHAARAFRALALRHPEFSRFLLLHQLNTPGGLRYLESMLAMFHDAGFPPEAAARGFRVLGYFLMGAVLDETAGYAHGPAAAQPVEEAVYLALAPRVVEAGRWFEPDQVERTFELGLDIMVAGLEALRERATR